MRSLAIALGILVAVAAGCATPKGSSTESRRAYVHDMRDEALDRLFEAHPTLRADVRAAAGYAVFSNLSVQVFPIGAGHGYGLAHDNASGRNTYMRMAQLDVGLGLGVKDFRVVFVFHDPDSFRSFVDQGWQLGADGEASAIADGDKGISLGAQGKIAGTTAAGAVSGTAGIGRLPAVGAASRGAGLEIYQLTKNGLVLRASLAGTKYWKDGGLN